MKPSKAGLLSVVRKRKGKSKEPGMGMWQGKEKKPLKLWNGCEFPYSEDPSASGEDTSVSGVDTSEYTGRYLRAANGEDLVVIECVGPVSVSDRSKEGGLFDNMEDGDLVTVRLGLIQETYPGKSEAFACSLAEEDTVDYGGKCYKKADLSKETLDWLEFYHGLSPEDQAKISMIPHELVPQGQDMRALETDAAKEPAGP